MINSDKKWFVCGAIHTRDDGHTFFNPMLPRWDPLMILEDQHNFIGGVWIESRTASKGHSATFENINPAHKNEVVAEFQDSARIDVDYAVDVAYDAFKMWKNTPAPHRGEILYKAAEILVRDKECIALGMTQEMGKCISETRGDVQEAIDMAYYAAGEGRRMAGEVVPS